jgi:hypothetical protein
MELITTDSKTNTKGGNAAAMGKKQKANICCDSQGGNTQKIKVQSKQ